MPGQITAPDQLPGARQGKIDQIADIHRIEAVTQLHGIICRAHDLTPPQGPDKKGGHAGRHCREQPSRPAGPHSLDEIRPLHTPEREVKQDAGHKCGQDVFQECGLARFHALPSFGKCPENLRIY